MTAVSALPHVTIEVGGAALTAGDAGALEQVRVQQRVSLPTQCELAFVNPQGPLADAKALPAGESLRIAAAGFNSPLFTGEITAIEHSYDAAHAHEVHLRGYDLLHRLRKRQPVRAHVQITARELAQEMLDDLGFHVEAAEDGPLFRRIIQHRQSDLDLLTEVLERCGLYYALRSDTLQLFTLEGTGEPVPLILGQKLFEARIEVNGDSGCRSVTASAWDPWRAERHEARASQPRVGLEVATEFPPGRFELTGERTLTEELAQDDRQAEAIAQAELDRRVAGEVTLWGTAEGDPSLSPGSRVQIRGVAASLSGCYVLTTVIHQIDRRTGFVTEFSTSPPRPRPRTRAASLALGVVLRVDDPDGLGRVRLSLPNCCNVETDWIGVVASGAGAGKGFVILPNVGDQVLVLLAHDDPAQGLVLGGLYGSQKAPDYGIDGGSVRRYTLVTGGGQSIQLDDSHQKIRMENADGSFVELSPEEFLIHSKVKLRIEAPGQQILIRGKAIDFEQS